MRFLFLFLICVIVGCSRKPLELYTQRIGIEQYASFHVKTPDPFLACPEIGQRLIVKWDIPPCFWKYPLLHVVITLRFFNGEENFINFPVRKFKEIKEWKLVNEDFAKFGGIATYKAELLSEEVPLFSWYHILWNETISLGGE